MQSKQDGEVRFFPIFLAATASVMIDMVAQFVDEIVAGNLFDDASFASVNLIEPYTYLAMFIAYLICVGGAALIVRAQGAGDRKKMSELFSQSVILCVVCGAVLTLIYILFTPQLVRLVADDPAVYAASYDFFKAMRFYPLVIMLDTFLITYVLYMGGFVQFYIASIMRIVVNAALSWFLGLRYGMTGVGAASILSFMFSLGVGSTFLLTKKHKLKFRWYLNAREAIIICRLGLVESAVFLFEVIFMMAVNAFTLKHYSVVGVAAVSVVINASEFMYYISEGISEYETVAINKSIGQRSGKSMDRSISVTLRAAVIEGLAVACIILLFARALPAAFDIDDAETARLAAVMLRIFAPAMVFICLTRVTVIFYQYTRRIIRALFLFGGAMAALPIAFVMIFGQLSLEGVAIGIALGSAAAVALMYGYVRLVRKEKFYDYTLLRLE